MMSEEKQEKSVPFYPDHLALEAKVALGVGIIVLIFGVVGLFNPVGLGAPADPMDTPAHIKPEWYFLSLYQLLRFIPETLGATAPVVAILLIMVWPFLDRGSEETNKPRRLRFWFSMAAVLIIIALTIWGEVS
jgi:quinol-cytochrome oxidoreductase complex cytochrome b subunit